MNQYTKKERKHGDKKEKALLQVRPVPRFKVSEAVMGQILELVFEGGFPPGSKLPGERELAARFKVNRATLRQALHTLSLLRVLEIRHGDGVYVRADQSEASVETLLLKMLAGKKGSEKSLRDLMEIRMLLEVPLSGLAALRAKKQEKEKLKQALEGMEEAFAVEDLEAFAAQDFEFHRSLVRLSHNELAERLVNSFYSVFRHFFALLAPDSQRAKKSLEQHRAIFAAVQSGKKEAAESAMRAHLEDVMREIEAKREEKR